MTALDTAATVGRAVVMADTAGMDRADWLELRRTGIGGSDAAAICGLNPYTSPLGLWLEKCAAPGTLDDDAGEAAEWGQLLEPIVRDQTAVRTGLAIEPAELLLRHETYDWMLANVDGLVWDRGEALLDPPEGLYEGKTAGVWTSAAWADDQVPEPYVLQGQHYLAVTGLPWIIYGVLIAGQRLEVRRVERDEELIGHLIALEADFWQRVAERTPPEPDGSPATSEVLGRLYEVEPESVLIVNDPEAVREQLRARADAKTAEKAAKTAAAEAENRIKVLLGPHEIARDHDGRVLCTWRQLERSGIDLRALRAAHPDLVDAFTSTSTYRRFHVPKAVTIKEN